MYAREHAPGFHHLLSGILSNAGVVPKVVQTAGEMSTLISLVDAARASRLSSICRKKNRLQGGRVLDYRSTAGVRDWVGVRTAEHCGGSTPIL
jgi:hypothetical protein